MSDDRKDLPPAKSTNFLEKAREALQVYLGTRGDVLDRGVTLRDLVESGIVKLRGNLSPGSTRNPISGPGVNVGDPYEEDLTPPPTPSDFTATAAISNLIVECGAPTYTQGNGHAKSRLYGVTYVSGDLPVFSEALARGPLTEFGGTVASYATNPATTWHLWLTWVTVDGVESTVPAGGTNGVVTRTGEDVSLLLDALSGEIAESQLHNTLGTRIDLIDSDFTIPGSVDYRVKLETDARVLADGVLNNAIAAESLLREGDTTALSAVIESREALRDGLSAALQSQVLTQADDAATLSAAISTEIADRSTAVAAESLARTNADIAEAEERVEADTIEAKARLDQEQVDAEALLRSILVADADKLAAASEVTIAKNQMTERTDAGLLAEATSRLTLAAKLDTDIASTLAVVTAESVARSTAISAEAAERTLLATQFRGDYTGSDPALLTSGLLYEERLTRVTEDQALAQQITLLSAGAGEQFDWKAIWYFDDGVEGWTGNGTPTVASGYLRPADQVSGAYVASPTGIGSDGNQYGQVRLRVRQVGTPTWAAKVYWRGVADSTWDVARSLDLDEPTWDVNGIGLVTATPGWAVTVDRIRVDLSDAQTGTDYYELDWVALGRPSPGASSAQLLEEQTARAAADSALTTSVTTLNAQVNNATTGLPATNALIIAEQITRADADIAEASARTTLAARVTTAEGNITTNAADITTEQTTRADADTAISGTVSTLSATVTDLADGLVLTDANLVETQEALATATEATVRDVTALQANSEEIDEATLRAILEGQAIKDAYNGELALARQELTTQIEVGVLAEATERLSLTAVVNENAATLETEKTTRANETSALSTSITTLFSVTDGNTAGLLEAQTTLTTADAALSAVATALSAKTDGNAASVLAAQTASTTADGALSSQIVLLNTSAGDTKAALQVEQVSRSDDTSSLAAQITSVSATAGTISGELTAAQEAIATDKGAYVADTKVLRAQSAEVDETTLRTILEGEAIKGAYNGELAIARQDLTTQIEAGVFAESQYRLALAAVVDSNAATLTQEILTRATETDALSQSVTTLFADTGANSAALTVEQLTRTTEDESLAAQTTSLAAVTGLSAAAIQTEQTVRTTDTIALAAQNATLAVATGANAAANTTEQLARTTDDSAIAANVQELISTTGANTASISNLEYAVSDPSGSVAGRFNLVEAKRGAVLNADPEFRVQSAWEVYSALLPLFVGVWDGQVGLTAIRSTGAGVMSWCNGKDRIALDSTKTYSAKGWLRTISGSGSVAYLGVALFDAAGQNISGDGGQWFYFASGVSPNGSWSSYASNFGANTGRPFPVNAKFMSPLFILSYGGGTSVHEAQGLQIEDVTEVAEAKASITTLEYAVTNPSGSVAQSINTLNARLNVGGDTYEAINTTTNTASAKSATFVQGPTPTATKTGDLWIDTSDSNKLKTWNGSSWVLADDQRIGSTASQVTTLQSSINAAGSAVNRLHNSTFLVAGVSSVSSWNTYNNAGAAEPTSVTVVAGADGYNAARVSWSGVNTQTKGIYQNMRDITIAGTWYIIAFKVRAQAGLTGMTVDAGPTNSPPYSDFVTLQSPVLSSAWQWYVAKARRTAGNSTELFITISGVGSAGLNEYDICQPIVHEGEVFRGYNEGPLTASLQIEATTRATQTGELYGQYTVKLDVDGKVSGYGLASTGPTGTGSTFEIRADKFVIAAPTGSAAGVVPFVITTESTVVDGVTVPAGTYIQDVFIKNATITNAKIGFEAVDDSKISGVSITKLTAGTLTSGEWMQSANYVAGVSGWRINSDATGTAEFGNATIRGHVEATAGLIGGNTIDATSIRSGTTGYGTGSGFYLGSDGAFSLGTKLTWSGSVLAVNGDFTANTIATSSGKFAVSSGGLLTASEANISGAITATSGSFTGTVTGSTITTGANFSVDIDGKLIADTARIKRRFVVETGSITPTEVIVGSYTESYGEGTQTVYYSTGAIFTGSISKYATCTTADASMFSNTYSQPYTAAVYGTGAFGSFSGNASSYKVIITGHVSQHRTFSNTGNYAPDGTLIITFNYKIEVLSGTFNSFTLPSFHWALVQT